MFLKAGVTMNRKEYETEIAQRLEQWRIEIAQMRQSATHRDVPGVVGDEQTQVEKAEGQWEMAQVQFNQLQAVDTAAAWDELRAGLDKKLTQLVEAMRRTQAQIGGR